MFRIEAETLTFVRIHVAWAAQNKNETFDCDLSSFLLPAVGPDIFKPLFCKLRLVCSGSTGLRGYSVCVGSRISLAPRSRRY